MLDGVWIEEAEERRGTRKTRNVWMGLILIIEINKKRDHTLDSTEMNG